jgi:hypothetical protein
LDSAFRASGIQGEVSRLTAVVGYLLADLGNLGMHLEHDALDSAPGRKIATPRAPHRLLDNRQGDASDLVDLRIDIVNAVPVRASSRSGATSTSRS